MGGMIPGNEVQLRHSYQPLVLCEVEIFGKTAGYLGSKELVGVFIMGYKVKSFFYENRLTDVKYPFSV